MSDSEDLISMDNTAKASPLGSPRPTKVSAGLAALDKLREGTEQRTQAKRAAERDELDRISAGLHTLERSGGLSAAELLELLTQTLGSAPAVNTSSLLTDEQETALREAGSFVDQMPAFMSRASTVTALQGISIVAGSLPTGQVASMLGLTDGRIRQRAADRTLFSIRVGSALRFPSFQFLNDAEIPGWEKVASAFPTSTHPVAVATFMSRPHEDLTLEREEVSPNEWLTGGGDPQVVVDIINTAFKVHP